jgi:single-stranded DNA-binding protein
MYTMNQLMLIGFTGQDAEIHYTQNGTLVTTLSVATKNPGRTRRAPGRAVRNGTGWSYSGRSLSTRAR